LFGTCYLQSGSLNPGSGICIDRQHLELWKVRHINCKAVQDIQLVAPLAQNRISNLTIRGQKIDPQDGAVTKIDVAYENRRGGSSDPEGFTSNELVRWYGGKGTVLELPSPVLNFSVPLRRIRPDERWFGPPLPLPSPGEAQTTTTGPRLARFLYRRIYSHKSIHRLSTFQI
jgi:hypothetical protein